jgi:hypothetical protein
MSCSTMTSGLTTDSYEYTSLNTSVQIFTSIFNTNTVLSLGAMISSQVSLAK